MAVGDAYVFPGFLTPELTQLFFPKQPTTFLTCFCRGDRRKYAGKKSRFNRGSNSQPPGHESDTVTTEPPGRGLISQRDMMNESSLKGHHLLKVSSVGNNVEVAEEVRCCDKELTHSHTMTPFDASGKQAF